MIKKIQCLNTVIKLTEYGHLWFLCSDQNVVSYQFCGTVCVIFSKKIKANHLILF